MNAVPLREAARLMRSDQMVERDLGHIDEREYRTWLAMADLLDRIAWIWELDSHLQGRVGGDETLAVATAYLGTP